MVEPAAPVAVTLAVTVGGCTVVPPARGPGMDITMLPPVTPTVGVPEPRFVPPASDTLLTVAFAGTGMRTEMFEMWFTVAVTPEALCDDGICSGCETTATWKIDPASTEAGAVVSKPSACVSVVLPTKGTLVALQLNDSVVELVSAEAGDATTTPTIPVTSSSIGTNSDSRRLMGFLRSRRRPDGPPVTAGRLVQTD